MDNKQIKVVSLVLLVLVIVFSISTVIKVTQLEEARESAPERVDAVTTGRVTLRVVNPPKTQGQVNINIIPTEG